MLRRPPKQPDKLWKSFKNDWGGGGLSGLGVNSNISHEKNQLIFVLYLFIVVLIDYSIRYSLKIRKISIITNCSNAFIRFNLLVDQPECPGRNRF